MGNSPGVHDAQVGPPRRDNKGVTIKGRPEAACHCDAGSGPGLLADSGSEKRDRRLVAAALGQIADAGEAENHHGPSRGKAA
jgi:hypothetical protein